MWGDEDRYNWRWRPVDRMVVFGTIIGLLIGGLVGATVAGAPGFIVGDVVGGVLGAATVYFIKKSLKNRSSR